MVIKGGDDMTIRTVGCVLAGAMLLAGAAQAQVILSGNDEKFTWNAMGKTEVLEGGHDSLTILSIAKPAHPKIIANLPVENSILGPPTNLGVVPGNKIALIANSMHGFKDGDVWKQAPDNKLFVIDLTTSPPSQIAAVETGKQPSGIAISKKGDLALVTNRADNSLSVLAISGKDVKVVGVVPVGETTPGLAITPDGKRALVLKPTTNRVAVFDIDGQTVTPAGIDIGVGVWPYNVMVTPNGKLALVACQGQAGASDGSVDSVAVIDLETKPPRTIDFAVVGDTPEGLAISPRGDVAVAVLVRGTNADHKAWFYNRTSAIDVLKIDHKKVTRVAELDVGAFAEGAGFSPDGSYLYVSNFFDSTLQVFSVAGTEITNTGTKITLPGHPASMAVSTTK
jgi:DNA-binding beta-propeller fold protein YncE